MSNKNDDNLKQPRDRSIFDVVGSGNSRSVQIRGHEVFGITYSPEHLVSALMEVFLPRSLPSKEDIATYRSRMKNERNETITRKEAVRHLHEHQTASLKDYASHIAKYIAEQLGNLVGQMASSAILREGRLVGFQEADLRRGNKPKAITAKQVQKEVQGDYWPFVKERMGIGGPGGDKRSNRELAENTKNFAQKTDELLPLWRHIKDFHYKNGGGSNWSTRLKETEDFKLLSANCTNLTDDLIAQMANSSLGKREREPLILACKHALLELGISKKYGARTMQKYYRKGKERLTQV